MRVVFDTNILISAFVFPGGAPEYAYRAAIQGDIESVTSPVLLAEFARVLSEKFRWDPRMVEEAVSQVARIGTVASPVEEVAVVKADPDDDRGVRVTLTRHGLEVLLRVGQLERRLAARTIEGMPASAMARTIHVLQELKQRLEQKSLEVVR